MAADPVHPPSFDPLPLEAAVSAHPLVTATRRLSEALLVPQAAQVDATEVPASHVRAIAEAGLLGRTAPVEHGGGGASTRVGLAVTELLAGACGNTWFVVTQHGSPMRAALATSHPQVRDELLPGLLRSVLVRLHELGTRRREQRAVDLAVDLGHTGAAVRSDAYEIIERGAVAPAVLAGTVEDQVRLRAHAAEMAVRASAALVAAGGGASMALSNPAQRWAREALFHLIQAQTGPIRSAQLDRLASGGRA